MRTGAAGRKGDTGIGRTGESETGGQRDKGMMRTGKAKKRGGCSSQKARAGMPVFGCRPRFVRNR